MKTRHPLARSATIATTTVETKNETEAPRSEADAPPASPGEEPVIADRAPDAPAKPATASRKLPAAAQIDDLFAAIRRLESFAADEAKRVSGKLVPNVEEQAKKNIWVSLLLALGLGLILGLWLTGGRRRE